ncbi:GNAT family N-acetyltransferase [Candidatus Hydrogenedentota bacterium]
MNTEEFIVNEMRAEDVGEACELWYSIPELEVSRSFDTHERIGIYLRRNPGFSTVARKSKRIVGAVMCGHDGRRGSFYSIGVLQEFRGQGIAKRMVERSLSCLREIGITTAFLFTHEKNLTAQAFWRQTGWEHCPWVQYHYREFDAES